ncbi:MAG: hypothetical protein V1872_00055 [bacterium]
MKKIVFAIYIVAVLFIINSTVWAVEMQFNGDYRIRGFLHDFETIADEHNTTSYNEERFRLGLDAIVSDSLKGVAKIDIGAGVWGEPKGSDENYLSNNNNNDVRFYEAYIDFDIPQTTIDLSVGTQVIEVGQGILLDAPLDSVIVTLSQEMASASVLFAKGTNSENSLSKEDDEDYYGLILNTSGIAENINLGIYGFYLHDEDPSEGTIVRVGNYDDADGYYVGLSGEVSLEPLNIAFEVDYSYTKYKDTSLNFTDEGLAVYADIGLDVKKYGKIGVDAILLTGDDSTTDNKNEAFKPIELRPSDNDFIVYVWEEDIVVTGNIDDLGFNKTFGVEGARIYASLPVLEGLNVKGKLGCFWRIMDEPFNNTDRIGIEVDGYTYYNIYDSLLLKGFGGYLFSDEQALGTGAEDAWRLGYRLTYLF